jgi:hypothetical protein
MGRPTGMRVGMTQNVPVTPLWTAVRTLALEIAYEESEPETSTLVVLHHGFPDDARADDATREAVRP